MLNVVLRWAAALLSVAVIAGGLFLVCGSSHFQECVDQARTSYENSQKPYEYLSFGVVTFGGCFIEKSHEAITAFSTLVIAIFTILLGLIALHQTNETRVLQRAYVSANPNGIENTTTEGLVGHVVLHNVGRLPAKDLSCLIKIVRGDEKWRRPPISEPELTRIGTLATGTQWTMGSDRLDAQNDSGLAFVYVWGRVVYLDGFGRRRFTEFGHRYPWAKRVIPSGGGLRIDVEYARPHDDSNDAD